MKSYLINEYTFIQNGNSSYTTLSEAVSKANDGDVLLFTANGNLYENLIIPAEKNIILNLNGFSLTSNKEITNNGSLTISGGNSNNSKIESMLSTYMITNNNGATLTINNLGLESPYVLKNNSGGTFNGNYVTIVAGNTAINNLGSMSIDNFDITGSTYGVYNSSSSDSSISNSTINPGNNPIYNSSGNLTIVNSTIINTLNSEQEITNNGTMTLDNSIAKGSDNKAIQNDGTMNIINNSSIEVKNTDNNEGTAYGIKNTNTLNINNSNVAVILNSSSIWKYNLYGLHNTGNVTLENSDVSIVSSGKYNHYGIYTETGNAIIKSGNIDVEGLNSYGVYLKSGSVTLGVPEVPGSATYGKENADVSITSPLIQSLGSTNAVGIMNENNNGAIRYYDGKVVAINTTLSDEPNEVEYLYEPKEFIDEETGYKYVILKWMREPGSG